MVLQQVSKLSGAEFDRMFAQHMADHQKDISKYQAQAKKVGPVAAITPASGSAVVSRGSRRLA
jgi:hypothetical protein